MKFKRLIPLLAGLALLVTGCYKDDIIALQKQIDEMSAFDLDRQVKEIEATLKLIQESDFQKGIDAVNAALSEKETALKNQINDLNTQISAVASSSSSKVDELEAQLVGLTAQLAQVQSSIKVLEGVDLPKTVEDLKKLMQDASTYGEEIATLKNQFAGLDLDKKLADIKAAYETAIATSKEEMENYFNSNFQKKFEELFSKTQETIEHWITNSESFQDLISEFADLQDEVSSQISVLGLRGKEIDSLKNMASAVEYDIKKAIENAINTLQVGDIKTLKDDTDSLKKAVAKLRSDVDALQELPGKIGDFNKLQTTLVDAIVALQEANKVDDQTLKDLVLALKANLLDADGSLVDIKNIISQVNANSTQIAENRDNIFINATDIAALAEKVGTLPTTDVTDALAADISKIQGGEIGKYNLGNIVTDITNITTALSNDSGELIGVKNIVAQLNALLGQVGTPSAEQEGETIYGLIAGLDAKLGLIGNKTLKEYVDSTSNANKKALADSLDKVNTVLSGLDARIDAIDGDEVNSLVNRVKALEDIVGKGELATSAKTLIGAINELVDRLDDVDGDAATSLKNLIVALQADLLTIEGGKDHNVDISSVNLYTLNDRIAGLKTLLDGYQEIDFNSKKGAQALKELVTAVSGIQTTISDHVTTTFLKDTLNSYYTKKEADGLFQTITEFKKIIGEGTTPATGTVLARIAVLEAATAKIALEEGGDQLSLAEAIQEVFGDLKDHKTNTYHVTQEVIEGIQNDITAINALLAGKDETLTGFTAPTVIGALNELKTGLASATGNISAAVDSLASKRIVDELKADVTNAHQALINAMLGITSGPDGDAVAAGKLVQDLKTTLATLEESLKKLNVGGEGQFTVQQAVDSLNNRISAVNTAVNALIGDGFGDKSITEYIGGLEATLNSLNSATNNALDTVKANIRGELADVQAAIINGILGVEGSLDDLKTLNLSTLAERVKTLEEKYVSHDELATELAKISGSLGGLYTNAQIDSMVSKIINAFYNESGSAASRLDSLNAVKTMVTKFKTDIATALAEIGDTTVYGTGSTLSQAIKDLKDAIGALGEKVGDDNKGLVKKVNEIDTELAKLADIPTRVSNLETAINAINTNLGDVLTKTQVDSAVLALAKALYVGTEVADTNFAAVRTMMQEFKTEIAKISTVEGKISDAETNISDLQTAVGDLQTAIADFVNSSDFDELSSNFDKLSSDLDELSGALDDLESRVGDLEEQMSSLVDIVQSIVYVPQFEDGMIYVDGIYQESTPQTYKNPHNNVELDFRINTYRGYKFNPENYTFTGYITSTKIPTKAYAKGGDGFPMKVLSYGGEEGAYKHILALQFNSKEIADDDPFWSGNAGASIAVEIMETNGNSLTTEYIPLKLNRTTEVPSDPGDDPEEPQGVKFVVSPTEQTVGNAGGQIEVKVTSAHYWILEGITDDPGIFYFGSAYGGISATIGGSQYSRPFFTGTQIVYFNIPAYTNTRATANGKLPGEALEYTFTFKEYDSNSLDRFNNPNGNNTGTATLTIRQTPRKTQEFETDPAECKNGITVEWNETDTTFFVMPSDQKSDFILNPSPVDWVTFDRDDTGEAGVAEITLNFTERPKTKEGYYGERETTLRLTAATGENTDITIKQLPHPAAGFKFYEGESGDTEVNETTAHTFEYGDYDDVNPFKFRVVPGDGLSGWTYDGDSSFDEKFDVSVSSKDGDGMATVTVSPKAYNADYDNDVTGSITFTLADDETTATLNFVQSKREASALNVAPDEISFTWDGKKTGETSKDTVHVSVTAEDGFNDWVVKNQPSWVEEITNNGDGIAVIKLNADNNDAGPRTEPVTFCINSEDETYDQDLNITQTARPEDEIPELKITLAGTDDAFDSKEFKWNAAESTVPTEKSVTFNVSSSFSGDDWVVDTTGFGPEFTLAEVPTKGSILVKNYSVTANVVNNNWEDDVEKIITFTPKSATGDPVTDKAVELTFKITKRGGDGAAPTITLNPEVRDTTFTCKGYVKKSNKVSVYEFTVEPGTFTEDSWTCEKDEVFSNYFVLDSTGTAASRTYKVSVKTPLDDAEHIGKLTFTPTAGEESGDPVVMTFKKEAYTQNLTFTENSNTITSGADLSPLKWKTASDNKIVIKVTADNADANHQYTAAITTGGDDFTITPESSTSESETTFTITPNSDNKDGEDRAGVVTFTSTTGSYTFNFKQPAYKQNLSFTQKVYGTAGEGTALSDGGTVGLTYKASDYKYNESGYNFNTSEDPNSFDNIIAITVTSDDSEEYTAKVESGSFKLVSTLTRTRGSWRDDWVEPSEETSLQLAGEKNNYVYTKTFYVLATNRNDSGSTGELVITSASGYPYTFTLNQNKRAAQTFTANPASGGSLPLVFVTGTSGWSRGTYGATFANSSTTIAITSSDGESDWRVKSAEGPGVDISNSKQDNNITLTASYSNQESQWSNKTVDVTIILEDWAGNESEPITFKWQFSDFKGLTKVTSTSSSKTITVPDLGSNYSIKGKWSTTSNWSELSATVGSNSATKTSDTNLGNLSQERKVTVSGTNSRSGTQTTTLTLTLTGPNSLSVTATYTYQKSSGSYSLQ